MIKSFSEVQSENQTAGGLTPRRICHSSQINMCGRNSKLTSTEIRKKSLSMCF